LVGTGYYPTQSKDVDVLDSRPEGTTDPDGYFCKLDGHLVHF